MSELNRVTMIEPYTREYLQHRRQEREDVRKSRRSLFLGVMLGAAATASAITIAVANPFEVDRSAERASEDCVSALVGHRVDLVSDRDPLTIQAVQHPSSVMAEQRACDRADNSIASARELYRLSIQSRS